MKNLRILTLFALATIVTAGVASAQTAASQPNIDQAIEQARKDARTDVNTLITAGMGFTSDEAAKFWPMYKTYETQVKALNDGRIAVVKEYAQNYASMTDAKATELMQKALDYEAKAAAAKKGFLAEMQKVFPGKTVARFYQVHSRIDALITLTLAAQIPLVQ